MKILTHNLLQCNVSPRLCKVSRFPLRIEPIAPSEDTDTRDAWSLSNSEFNREFLERLLPRLNWNALLEAAKAIHRDFPALRFPQPPTHHASEPNEDIEIYSALPGIPWAESSDEWWHALHSLLFEYELVTGRLVCPSCTHVFPVTDTIPNMLLREDEV